jgi:hypothetical protein
LHILFEALVFSLGVGSFFDMGRHVHWIFDDFFAMSHAENHSMFALSPKPSYLKTSNLCTRVQIFHKKKLQFLKTLRASVSGIPGRNIRPHGWNIRGGADNPG